MPNEAFPQQPKIIYTKEQAAAKAAEKPTGDELRSRAEQIVTNEMVMFAIAFSRGMINDNKLKEQGLTIENWEDLKKTGVNWSDLYRQGVSAEEKAAARETLIHSYIKSLDQRPADEINKE